MSSCKPKTPNLKPEWNLRVEAEWIPYRSPRTNTLAGILIEVWRKLADLSLRALELRHLRFGIYGGFSAG